MVIAGQPYSGGPDCPFPFGFGVLFFSGDLYDSALPDGEMVVADERVASLGWIGQVYVARRRGTDVVVFVRTTDAASGQAILDSVRRDRG